ncbi:MAG: hypothetical protein UT67_C0004G0010 [Candidatus Magasanikbacteria bacterium GW2011_GWA2_40_10]|uniref:PT repeat-containing protein n=1 Tax=Candidatus Magasanikbacteria bacterium GW2011_GWA2_40_10 TaxID=1619037 RepID=A0A0G0QCG0_9BACT|nr:MAG: hypothetical protein UT67_C0004G0010 [Candidatus Magasanikbacteria bacterium GW2011_GWA2_40_10]
MLRKYFSSIFITIISAIAIGCVFFYFYPSRESLRAISSNDFSISAVKYINPLDGKAVAKKADSVLRVVGVMIDNHPDARPESGVSKAKIVYEAPVEGGLTRYLAIYDSKQVVPEVGPVRSARAYFLDWLQEYGNGLYMHSGGSPEALGLIKSRKIFDVNEFFWGEYYWRDQVRFAPHNLYTNSENWGKVVNQYGSTSSLFTKDKAWLYSKLVGQTSGKNGGLKIPFSDDYAVNWTYDAKAINYGRSLNGVKEIDKDGSEVRARNILVQITDVQDVVNDDKGRQSITTIGSGDAIILKKGAVVYGTWKKSSLTGRTRFYDKNKKEIVLVPGNTWVEVAPKDVNVVVMN